MRTCNMMGAPQCVCKPRLGLLVPRLAARSLRGSPVASRSSFSRSARRAALSVNAAAAPAIESPSEVILQLLQCLCRLETFHTFMISWSYQNSAHRILTVAQGFVLVEKRAREIFSENMASVGMPDRHAVTFANSHAWFRSWISFQHTLKCLQLPYRKSGSISIGSSHL